VTLIHVDVVKAVQAPVTPAFIRHVIQEATKVPEVAARMPRQGDPSVAVRITDAIELRRLNGSYADEDYATDVLSFEGVWPHLGDIAISWDAMVSQGLDYGHPPQTECALMCVHGLLHLLRWDHYEDAEREEMWRLTVAGLKRAGVKLSDLRG
jgi:probable rRNA maturation factor